ncbi:acyltransferase [Panacibacter ginsenosidivorans]|uniref:Acyltransferase n=1 Tax=Panacibacter ginsenosidivorans TaxID=1813871 RepID=A0A5B8VHQ6_9BACT|nr:acyltransferase [Panacibacter ginsenosidivorans]QEC69818.1 acyltransferase [Panacibacter ginsenosidivorans]
MQAKSTLYFKGLNGLRFMAALLVVFAHVPTFITKTSNPNIYDFRPFSFFSNGGLAVDFFFVLSGFLITSLLLKEHEESGTISVKRFYIRRMLRIWPLYYLIVFIAFAVFPILANIFHLRPDPGLSVPQLLMYILLLPNFTFIFGPRILLFPLWSIGVEEQFYLIIAPVIKYKKKSLALIFATVIIVKLFLNFFAGQVTPATTATIIILDLRFEAICIGCLGAIFIRSRYKYLLDKLFGLPLQLLFFGILFAVLFFNKTLPAAGIPVISPLFSVLTNRIYNGVPMGIVFLYVILCVSLNKRSIIKTGGKTFELLGNISYGMYMYHVMTCFVVIGIMKRFFLDIPVTTATIMCYLLCVFFTMLVAYLSYVFFEKRFLNLKKKFENA